MSTSTHTVPSRTDRTANNQRAQTSQPDHVETIIIKCDGSFHRKGNLAGIGYIIESNENEIIEKHHSESRIANTSTQTEAHACLTAIRAAKKCSPSHLILYSDCEPVIDKIKDGNPSQQKDVYHQIRHELKYIKHTTIKHTPRERNREAHDLAHLSLRKLKDRRLND
jgi:ribonuclease HI